MVAEYHHRAIAAHEDRGARLEAVVHYDPDRYEAISEEFGVPCIGRGEMLADDRIDAVAVCTPSGQHPEQAIAAAEAGKHVLVEKPMAVDLEDADRMIEVCEEAGVRLGVVYQRRAEPLFRKIRRALEAEDFGSLTLANVTMPYFRGQPYYEQAAWRGTWSLDGGGVLMNQGIHLIDLLTWYMGDPVEIRSFAGTVERNIEVEDVLGATLHFENGAVATVAATTTAEPGFPHRLEIYGTNGGFQLEGESIRRWTLADGSRASEEPPELSEAEGAGSGGDPGGIDVTGHVGILGDFLEAIREERAPMVDGIEGRRSLRTVLGTYRAAGLHVAG